MPEATCIYNLFPLLAGPIERWADHLPRIREMNFDWVYVNPFHYPGFSGSLYAIKDFDELHPIVRGGSARPTVDLVSDFANSAGASGLKVMMDLVVNHTSKDALLVKAHPEWYLREDDGSLRSPRAVDPVDPRKSTVWGDLAEIDYGNADTRSAQLDHWAAYAIRYAEAGIGGFRCDAAYQVPADFWRALIERVRGAVPGTLFAAETLGCTTDQALALADAGFDMLFNSAKWWDFSSPWLLDQYDQYRYIAPTIAFPESHDTDRLAHELQGMGVEELEAAYRLRYRFAACFSSAVMMPMGFEYGFAKRLHVVESRPADWEWEAAKPRLDLTGFIAATNAMKRDIPALTTEGLQLRVSAPHAPVLALARFDAPDARIATNATLLLLNADPGREHGIEIGPLITATGGRFGAFVEADPDCIGGAVPPGSTVTLRPLQARLFHSQASTAASGGKVDDAEAAKALLALAADRIAIEKVTPELDGGRFPVKRVVGDTLVVEADIFGDGHDKIAASVRYRAAGSDDWSEAPMTHVDNDRWRGAIPLTCNGRYEYVVQAWRDLFASWRDEVSKKHGAGQNISLELTEGQGLVDSAIKASGGNGAFDLPLDLLKRAGTDEGRLLSALMSDELAAAMAAAGPRTNLSRHPVTHGVIVDRTAARFSAWYEMFPRSQSDDANRHGTFDDVIRKLPYVRDMGFDVLYFTPIHPIGRKNRKGRNNSLKAGPSDPGSPYAIGSEEGGHDALHPELGTMEDFHRLIAAAHAHGLEIAMDFAIQCAPDHPWLKEHPEWFDWRPDGSIKFAENPPKKYEDIVNVHFYRGALPSIWYALRDVVLFWAEQGVRMFRVDNPHTKPLPFWEWMIADVQARFPDTIFLAEAFTRPKMMKRLAKLGYTQSYTYFTWRNTKSEIIEYLTELTQTEAREYYRPNFFANTPDINPPYLQTGRPAAFKVRGLLAATLSGVYGLYNGFELCEGRPVPGKEEYLDSEKYEIRAWDYDRPGNIRGFITRLNHIRRENPALHDHVNVRFYNAWNDNILVYGKSTPAMDNFLLFAVNLDQEHPQGASFEVPLWEFNLPDNGRVEVEDLLTGHRFTWDGKVQQVWLDPAVNPCAVWRIRPPGL